MQGLAFILLSPLLVCKVGWLLAAGYRAVGPASVEPSNLLINLMKDTTRVALHQIFVCISFIFASFFQSKPNWILSLPCSAQVAYALPRSAVRLLMTKIVRALAKFVDRPPGSQGFVERWDKDDKRRKLYVNTHIKRVTYFDVVVVVVVAFVAISV